MQPHSTHGAVFLYLYSCLCLCLYLYFYLHAFSSSDLYVCTHLAGHCGPWCPCPCSSCSWRRRGWAGKIGSAEPDRVVECNFHRSSRPGYAHLICLQCASRMQAPARRPFFFLGRGSSLACANHGPGGSLGSSPPRATTILVGVNDPGLHPTRLVRFDLGQVCVTRRG